MRQQKPAWWQLYALVPLMIGLVVIEHLDPLPSVPAKVVDTGIGVLTFGAMLVWVHFNGGLVEYYEMQRDKSLSNLKITVYPPESDTTENKQDLNLGTPPSSFYSEMRVQTERFGKPEDEVKWSLN